GGKLQPLPYMFAGEIHCRSAACLQGKAYLQGNSIFARGYNCPFAACLQGNSIFARGYNCPSTTCLQGNSMFAGGNHGSSITCLQGDAYALEYT
ncbi:hypothetical protein, partial [Providencia sp. PROV160]|uniref:hypothetical protein n=1 Tax=Providencia sp. PROV160 TaxID=2949869 RepID=UPI0023498DBF